MPRYLKLLATFHDGTGTRELWQGFEVDGPFDPAVDLVDATHYTESQLLQLGVREFVAISAKDRGAMQRMRLLATASESRE